MPPWGQETASVLWEQNQASNTPPDPDTSLRSVSAQAAHSATLAQSPDFSCLTPCLSPGLSSLSPGLHSHRQKEVSDMPEFRNLGEERKKLVGRKMRPTVRGALPAISSARAGRTLSWPEDPLLSQTNHTWHYSARGHISAETHTGFLQLFACSQHYYVCVVYANVHIQVCMCVKARGQYLLS